MTSQYDRMSDTFDNYDRKLLRALQSDASLSMDDLAAHVGLSRNATWRRRRLLEEAGVIRGRVALLDAAALGCDLSVFIAVRTDRHDAEWARAFAKAVENIPEITGAYRTSGDLDYLIRARVNSVAAYDLLYKKLIAQIPLSDVSASFVMEELKETTALPL